MTLQCFQVCSAINGCLIGITRTQSFAWFRLKGFIKMLQWKVRQSVCSFSLFPISNCFLALVQLAILSELFEYFIGQSQKLYRNQCIKPLVHLAKCSIWRTHMQHLKVSRNCFLIALQSLMERNQEMHPEFWTGKACLTNWAIFSIFFPLIKSIKIVSSMKNYYFNNLLANAYIISADYPWFPTPQKMPVWFKMN